MNPIIVRAISYIYSNNPSVAPYHSNEHMVGMMQIATVLAAHSVTSADLIELQLACLFHDYGHLGGHQNNDRENIETAIYGFRIFWDEYRREVENINSQKCLEGKAHDGVPLSFANIETIEDLIAVTEFPFVKIPESDCQRIIRDADLLYATMSLRPEIILRDLRNEIVMSSGRSISLDEMYEGQVAFMQDAIFFTEAARELFDIYNPTFFEKMREYISSKRTC